MIVAVDYKAGNLTSVQLAFEHLGEKVLITDKPGDILRAERVVFPGVGAAGAAMANLRSLGLIEPIREVIERGTPFLGICIGIQLLLGYSDEDGGVECTGIVKGRAKKFSSADPMCKIPQMGWNGLSFTRSHPLLEGIENQSEFYFVHSYYPAVEDESIVIGRTDYADVNFAAMIARGNLAAVQFHPERSGRIGLKMLANFAKWEGTC
ncbi:MAG: imidazole glycerol phosphate synthase, glutamine amidotransferase subunit [Planctomycetes bacterium GWF2_50_10]|nr:MAG: imidazole glycerol phosphate synthase, glutamine amidotransferase subunit [Planctomycetes bacterium GWF2_50_10]